MCFFGLNCPMRVVIALGLQTPGDVDEWLKSAVC
jgi:hypothetical protein